MKKPSAFENFLYLLSELERVIDMRDIRWPVPQCRPIQNRLAQIATKVKAAQAAQRRSDKPPKH